MQNKDYILRMIEQIGAALIALRRLILGQGDPEVVAKSLQSAAAESGIDLEMTRVLDADTLVTMLASGGAIDPARLWLMAEFVYLDALHQEAVHGSAHTLDAFRKAGRLFGMIGPGGMLIAGWPEAAERMREIEDRITAGLETE